MSRNELTAFSYCILGLVGRGGAGPHDIVRMMRQGRAYWSAAPSHYYAEPKRLAKLGYLRSRKEPGRTRPRTHYNLTAKGERALRDWLAGPTHFPRIQNEGTIRLMAGDFASDRALVESFRALRDEIADLSGWLDQAERVAETLPHRERYLRILHRHGRRLLAVHLELVDAVEREFGRPRRKLPPE
jgi:DNA-binding PadR family transcriptional regulator